MTELLRQSHQLHARAARAISRETAWHCLNAALEIEMLVMAYG